MTATQISNTLIVFDGGIFDAALATDFVMLAKSFRADGDIPTCLSALDICDIIEMTGPLLFGREGLGRRIEVYNWDEAKKPFYHIVAQGNLKNEVLCWIQRVSVNLQVGDRLTIILIGHGSKMDRGVILAGQSLSKEEMGSALSVVPEGVRILIVNEACFSGTWTDLALKLGPRKYVVVEAAASADQKAWSYWSASDRYRCTLFGSAFMHEISTYPERRISQHHMRIQAEMEHVAPYQYTNTHSIECSQRSLRSHNISHFILTPHIANSIATAASRNQRNHEETLTAREKARHFWAKLCRRSAGPGGEISSDTVDSQLATIQQYISNLGMDAAEINRGALVPACHAVLDGRGGEPFKERVLKTIKWQEAQTRRVANLLSHLVAQDLIYCAIEAEDAEKTVQNSNSGQIYRSLGLTLVKNPEVKALREPACEMGCFKIIFDDAFDWLGNVLVVNSLICPGCFNLKHIQKTIVRYLRWNPVG